MATIEMKDVKGKAAGTATLDDAVYGIEPNMHVMHHVVRAQQASWRQGTANTRTRGNVRGGGKKPWRQKGTGRARQGTIRAPQWVGGGTVFGPHTRSYDMKVNRKEVKLALKSVLSSKLADGEIVVVKDLSFEKPCTKDAVAMLKALELEGKRITVVIGNEDVEEFLSFRNIPRVNILPVGDMNAYELIDNKVLVISEPCLKYIEEVLA
ncbi:MAG: 50S ribosomal protein L4 [Eggerthellaceae bacterium]|jgi:large subunit ribosomal protein L4|nr:50S ribosomal protein L4 [Eggerthellaceae bacterium]